MKASEEHLSLSCFFFCEVVSVAIRSWFIIMHNARHNISKEPYVTPRLDSYSWLLQRCQWNSSTLHNLWTHNYYMLNTDFSQKCGAVCRELQHNCDCMQTTCQSVFVFRCSNASMQISQFKNTVLCCLWVLTLCSYFQNTFDRRGLFVFSRYIPPLLWGKSGHLQTALYGKLGRVSSPHPSGVRKYLPMQDGATSTFDLFEPIGDHRTGGDIFTHLHWLCVVFWWHRF